jgi:CrcB protein
LAYLFKHDLFGKPVSTPHQVRGRLFPDRALAWGNAMHYLLVFIGGGVGSTLRHTINLICPRLFGNGFPYHTFIINITGSTIMGLIAGYLAFKASAPQSWRLFLMTGILGGYTTFSAFSLDTALLYERGEVGLALFYVLGSVGFSIAGLFAGLALVRYLT